MKIIISDKSVALIVDGLQKLDDYMKKSGEKYNDRIPFLNVKSRVRYLLTQEKRKQEKLRRRKEKVYE